MHKLIVLSLVVLVSSQTKGQLNEIRLPLTARDSTGAVDSVQFGLHPQATPCIDDSLGEWEIPPDGCCGWGGGLCVSFGNLPQYPQSCLEGGVRLNLRRYQSTSQIDTYYVRLCGAYPIVFRWPSNIGVYFDSCKIRDSFGGLFFNANMAITDSLLVRSPHTSFHIFTWGPRGTTGVAPDRNLPTTSLLLQNYPNPFNPTTTISFQIASRSHVTVKVFDVLGREVVTLVDGMEEPGSKSVSWDAGNVASGVYICQLKARLFVETKTMLLIR